MIAIRPVQARAPLALALALLLFAAGCARVPVTPAPAPEVPTADRAAARAAQGEYSEAARLYARAAEDARGAERDRLYLAAGEAAARAGDAATANDHLDRVNTDSLDDTQRARLRLARTEARIADLPPPRALQLVPIPESGTPPAVAARTWLLRSQLLLAQDRVVEAVHALVQRDIWLLEPEQARANDERIWRILRARLPEDARLDALDRVDDTTRGWVALARIGARVRTDRAALEDALIDWERRFPGHPAGRTILPERFDYDPIAPGTGIAAGDGRGIGLALPLTGRFADPAAAVRDGFLAAYYASGQPRPRLHIYDTNAVADMRALVERARGDGVGLLVGPLDKNHVAELRTLERGSGENGGENEDTPPMPILALNYTETDSGYPGFYQFGLAPEDEAEAVAERAINMGLRRGLALVPDSDWGDRVLSAFRDALYYMGGEMVDYATYDPRDQDHAGPIKTLLKYRGVPEDDTEKDDDDTPPETDENGDPIERGRRQDADFIFIAAQPAEARLIRTQLRFYRAMRLPVLATSHVFTGKIDPARDSDLDGLMFADMPWALAREGDIAERRERIRELWPDAADRYLRLFALGHDAWALQARIRRGDLETGRLLDGDTGELFLQPDGEIHRALDWARFVRGRPEPMPEPVVEDVGAADGER
ncbi:LppC family lipoprotein [Salinisphaera sp. PC39]|uniref:penicillin-binding protein activator n=1 Tax=Salinisphaera sp. PC39 TaxID=1304156 RepID=UPI0033422479